MDRADEARTRAILDLQEGRGAIPLLDEAAALDVLRRARRIAVVGASPTAGRPSHEVMRYLQAQGYICVPINPLATEMLGQPAYPDLAAAVAASGAPFDLVDVFRRPEHVPEIAREAVATGCGALWLQLGVVSWEGARIAHDGGLGVVMDRCTAIEHRKLRPRP
ncbi:MAG: CoA-binding protein [Candidatus Limnocylindrales bacterium]